MLLSRNTIYSVIIVLHACVLTRICIWIRCWVRSGQSRFLPSFANTFSTNYNLYTALKIKAMPFWNISISWDITPCNVYFWDSWDGLCENSAFETSFMLFMYSISLLFMFRFLEIKNKVIWFTSVSGTFGII